MSARDAVFIVGLVVTWVGILIALPLPPAYVVILTGVGLMGISV